MRVKANLTRFKTLELALNQMSNSSLSHSSYGPARQAKGSVDFAHVKSGATGSLLPFAASAASRSYPL
jgi:hypothetical protein